MLSQFSYITQDYLPRDWTAHSGLGPTTLITNHDNYSDMLTSQSDLGKSSIKGFLSDSSRLCQLVN